MRKELAKEEGQRKRFRAVFSRFGKKTNYNGYSEETVLFRHVVDLETNKVVTDHLWFSLTKGFEQLKLSEGMQVEFDARVKLYTKGYVNTRYKIDKSKEDYKLSHPTKI
ncbi:MAG TPA: hypothetical protein VIN08_03820, partial [Ohtaekwangia sp.]|uniref:hypothetical protein n=1 Tax=Ohtaekwangia sp. TaxID=2066019 RepID=UPI002F9462F6